MSSDVSLKVEMLRDGDGWAVLLGREQPDGKLEPLIEVGHGTSSRAACIDAAHALRNILWRIDWGSMPTKERP